MPDSRRPDADIHPQFVDRWSPRSFDPTPLEQTQIDALFEAARWSPSCYNDQPWRFVWAASDSDRARFAEAIKEKNRRWAGRAPLFVVVACERRFGHNDTPNRWAAFDTGAAWMALALQAHALGLSCHAMAGIDFERAAEAAGLDSERHEVICMVAVGRRGPVHSLDAELREREQPNGRRPREETSFQGSLGRIPAG